jgi:hypothetical protein
MRKILSLLVILAMLGLTSCKKESKKDPSFCSSDWATESEDEYGALYDAYTTYASDMSTENCKAYKAAFGTYIDALRPYLDCATWTEADLQEVQDAIDAAEVVMNLLTCE